MISQHCASIGPLDKTPLAQCWLDLHGANDGSANLALLWANVGWLSGFEPLYVSFPQSHKEIFTEHLTSDYPIFVHNPQFM